MRDKKTLIYLLILSTLFLSMMTLLASAESGFGSSAKSFTLYSPDTKTFLIERNPNLRLPMASTTKIVTALLALESLDPDEVITVPKDAVGIEGSSLYLNEGDQLTVRDLVYGVLLQSANDAATVLALYIFGSTEEFAQRMNERVEKIGVTDTNFKNPHGLDDKDHYTTAHDLSLIAAEALQNEAFKQIAGTYKYSFRIDEKPRVLVNHNKLLKTFDGCIGVKTGYTKKSGRCLVSAAEKDGVTLVAVTLSDPNDWSDHKNMLNYGFENLECADLNHLISLPSKLPTVSNDDATLSIAFKSGKVVKHINDNIEYSIDLPEYIAHDVKKGDKIGELTLKIGAREEKINIIATHDLKIKSTKRRFI